MMIEVFGRPGATLYRASNDIPLAAAWVFENPREAPIF